MLRKTYSKKMDGRISRTFILIPPFNNPRTKRFILKSSLSINVAGRHLRGRAARLSGSPLLFAPRSLLVFGVGPQSHECLCVLFMASQHSRGVRTPGEGGGKTQSAGEEGD